MQDCIIQIIIYKHIKPFPIIIVQESPHLLKSTIVATANTNDVLCRALHI